MHGWKKAKGIQADPNLNKTNAGPAKQEKQRIEICNGINLKEKPDTPKPNSPNGLLTLRVMGCKGSAHCSPVDAVVMRIINS